MIFRRRMKNQAGAFRPRRGALVALVATVSGATLFWWGCSAEDQYALMSIFFDGVPDPNAPPGASGGFFQSNRPLFYHQPFAEQRCLECHPDPTAMQLTKDDGQVCLKCHEAERTKYTFVHGPVSVNACVWCHEPHFSYQENLLRLRTPDLCLQCHGDGTMESPIPGHEDLGTDCLSCHQGHGGDTRYFLREGISSTDLPLLPAPEAEAAEDVKTDG